MVLMVSLQPMPRKRSIWIIPKTERMVYEVEYKPAVIRACTGDPVWARTDAGFPYITFTENEILVWSLIREDLDDLITALT
jgi:hypothetical protein